jgi:hypothetical protein
MIGDVVPHNAPPQHAQHARQTDQNATNVADNRERVANVTPPPLNAAINNQYKQQYTNRNRVMILSNQNLRSTKIYCSLDNSNQHTEMHKKNKNLTTNTLHKQIKNQNNIIIQ